jgi:hypothetical protein
VTFIMPHRIEFIDRYSVRMKHELLVSDADHKYVGGTKQYLHLKMHTFVKEKHVENPEYPALSGCHNATHSNDIKIAINTSRT